jgi:hypothetical protein
MSPLLFDFAPEFAIRKSQKNQMGLKLNAIYQLLSYDDDDVILLEDNTETRSKNTGTLIDASKEVGLAVNVEETKYMLVSR